MFVSFKDENVSKIIKNEAMDICVICYGGCSSNTLTHTLEKNNYKCKTPIWYKIVCHCPEIINIDIPIIYLYRDPILAFMSMKRRGKPIWDSNQKKMNNNEYTPLSDENLLKDMIKQFKTWTDYKLNNKADNLYIIQYDELFKDEIKDKFEKILDNTNLTGFPISYIKPKNETISEINLNNNDKLLFQKYHSEIEYINNFSKLYPHII